MCDISFVIPVYNGQKYIERCIDSITKIGLPEDLFEIIVVDDCSTDNTLAVLYGLAKILPNLFIIPQQMNKKPGGARNTGLRKVKGKYVMFVDADDEVEIGLKEALSYVTKIGIDILCCRFRKQSAYDSEFCLAHINELETHQTVSVKTFCQNYYRVSDHLASYLFRSDYLKRMYYPFVEGVIFEDLDWVEYHIFHSESIQYYDSVIYSNYATPGSILHSIDLSKDADIVLFCYRRLLFAESVKDEVPIFYQKVFPISDWVSQAFSLRHMTRHSWKSVRKMYEKIGNEPLSFLEKFRWKWFKRICVKRPVLASLIVAFVHPIASLGREIVGFLRRIM